LSTYDAIAEVGSSLKRLIWDNISDKSLLGPEGSEGIILSHPNSNDKGTLSIFLYRIEEESYQKNQPWSSNGADKISRPPISLNLFYMITPHFDKNMKDHILNDHRLMGEVIRILYDHPVLKSPVLQGSLQDDKLNLRFISPSIDEINKIWSMPESTQYMISAYYEVSPLRLDSDHDISIRRVTTYDAQIRHKDE
jgi:hypothetical protein